MPLARGPDGRLGVAAAGSGRRMHVTFNVTTTRRRQLPPLGGAGRGDAGARGVRSASAISDVSQDRAHGMSFPRGALSHRDFARGGGRP